MTRTHHTNKNALWLITTFLVTAGCGGHRLVNDVQQALQPFGLAFGVVWPTNYNSAIASQWSYHSILDGGSENLETIVKLEMTKEVYALWRSNVLHNLTEFVGGSLFSEPRLNEQYSWWNPDSFPSSQVTLFGENLEADTNLLGKLRILAAERNDMYTLYIYGRLSKR